MVRRAILLASVALLLAFASCSPPVPAVRTEPPFVNHYTQQIRRDLTGKQRPEVERILGAPDSVTGSVDSSGTLFYKLLEKKRNWAVVDPRTENSCQIVIVRFEKGLVQDVEFRCW